jgi:cytochrome c5
MRRPAVRALPAVACALVVAVTGAAGAEPQSPAVGDAEQVAGAMLPAGEGRDILKAACISCHDLGGLQAYKGYYDAEKWRAMLVTMVGHGAQLNEDQLAVLTAYLDRHFGPDAK